MDNRVPRDVGLSALIETVDVMGAHAGVGRRPINVAVDEDYISEGWQECSQCHEAAFQAWKRSPHFKAYYTLLSRGRHNDARCLPCHVHEFDLSGGREAIVSAKNQSVNCMTCHEQKTPEKSWLQVCEACHTEVADPKGVYKQHVHNVCSTADAPATKPCTRG
jgi:hypothetical protein